MESPVTVEHTPEPWKVEQCNGCGSFEIHAEVDVEESNASDDSTMDARSILHAHFVSQSFDGAVKTEADARRIIAGT